MREKALIQDYFRFGGQKNARTSGPSGSRYAEICIPPVHKGSATRIALGGAAAKRFHSSPSWVTATPLVTTYPKSVGTKTRALLSVSACRRWYGSGGMPREHRRGRPSPDAVGKDDPRRRLTPGTAETPFTQVLLVTRST